MPGRRQKPQTTYDDLRRTELEILHPQCNDPTSLATPVAGRPSSDGRQKRRCAIGAGEPVVAILLRDLEARGEKQQLELGGKVHVAGEVGDEALDQRASFEPVVEEAHISALDLRV